MTGSGMLHEAFLFTWHGTDEESTRQRLLDLFPGARPEQVRYAMHLAWTLRDVTVSVMVRMRSGIITQEEAMEELRRRCPGFEGRTYHKAWATGLCEASW